MGEIEVMLADDYPNQFITTVSGYIIRRNEWTKVNEDDGEIRILLQQNRLIKVKGEESLRQKIIIDGIPPNTIKEEPLGMISTKNFLKPAQEKKNDSPQLPTNNN